MHASSPGTTTLLLLEALFASPRPRMYLLELIRPAPGSLRESIKETVRTWMYRLILPRALAGAQVMTHWEIVAYANKFHLPPARFTHIPFPMMLQGSGLPAAAAQPKPYVMSSGRAACDWPTLFAAFQQASWDLVVVCAKSDRALVDSLNINGRAQVLSEISGEEHERLLREASIYALIMREIHASSGQVRFARTIEAGIPVVASAVKGLQGYLEDGVNALAVAVGDPTAVRQAIDRLLADKEARGKLRQSAYDNMRPRSLERYVTEVKVFVLS